MDAEHLQAIAARDQLWSSLRTLLPDIERIGQGNFEGDPRDQQIIQLLARITLAELQYRAEHSAPESQEID